MAKLIVALKGEGGRMEIETTHQAAMRVLNRYVVFMQSGTQAANKFPIDGAEPGLLALHFDNVLAVQVLSDE